jgi:hypothetical protein
LPPVAQQAGGDFLAIILAIDRYGMLVLKDYWCNIRQMLRILDRLGPPRVLAPQRWPRLGTQ